MNHENRHTNKKNKPNDKHSLQLQQSQKYIHYKLKKNTHTVRKKLVVAPPKRMSKYTVLVWLEIAYGFSLRFSDEMWLLSSF